MLVLRTIHKYFSFLDGSVLFACGDKEEVLYRMRSIQEIQMLLCKCYRFPMRERYGKVFNLIESIRSLHMLTGEHMYNASMIDKLL